MARLTGPGPRRGPSRFSPDPADMAACRAAIRTGSRSFHAASKLLPGAVRDPALALYAFCRQADDAVDLATGGAEDRAASVARLRRGLARVYAGAPADHPTERCFAEVVRAFDLPRALPEALVEGLAWDAEGRRCADLSELRAYGARVAGSVGAMMTVLMGVRDADVLARACDLGVAMQLTNIARDVAEDAAAGRLYLPLDLLRAEGVDPERFLARPAPSPGVLAVRAALLREAERLYRRAEPGIAGLPGACRPGIWAARLIYAEIGARVEAGGATGFHVRAVTSQGRKAALAFQALLRAGGDVAAPCAAGLRYPPLPETAFLVAAAARPPLARADRTGRLISILSDLEARDRAIRGAIAAAATWPPRAVDAGSERNS
ncbi:phytoene/squalene synthase family protein [Albimonas sp. CAU 1670]|uniref:phytoene/squalene synthase family protein n=1 Tax=Albimonas sp. CAU 1670 TaxID=3032599 RepID=UPI0023DA706C|nr:phytoene/squalene synthase family protein [Albimonas sp. CAU 1670]MDF2231526.1 phytoene/squalene synthase family protein [Albimonas sp. CAU 1670]